MKAATETDRTLLIAFVALAVMLALSVFGARVVAGQMLERDRPACSWGAGR